MIKFLIMSSLLFATQALAIEDSGLNCTMSYSATGPLSSSTDSTSRWIVANQEMEGSAVSSDGDGLWGTSPANYLAVSKTKSGGFENWTVTITDAEKNYLGSFSFPLDGGMKATLPSNAFMAGEDEDPPHYDKLEVSCYFTVFAG